MGDEPVWVQGLEQQGETVDYAIRMQREFYGHLQERANLRNWTVPQLLYTCLMTGLGVERAGREGRDIFIQEAPGGREILRVIFDEREMRDGEWRAE